MEGITNNNELFIENCAVNNIIGVFRINSSINVDGSLKIILLLIRSIILRLIGNDVDLKVIYAVKEVITYKAIISI